MKRFLLDVLDNSTDAPADVCSRNEGSCANKHTALQLRLVAIFVIFMASTMGFLLPTLGRRLPLLRHDGNAFLVMKAFSAGVILATGFVHMFPDALDMLGSSCLPEHPWQHFPFAGLFATFAALITQVIEFLATSYYEMQANAAGSSNGQSSSQEATHRLEEEQDAGQEAVEARESEGGGSGEQVAAAGAGGHTRVVHKGMDGAPQALDRAPPHSVGTTSPATGLLAEGGSGGGHSHPHLHIVGLYAHMQSHGHSHTHGHHQCHSPAHAHPPGPVGHVHGGSVEDDANEKGPDPGLSRARHIVVSQVLELGIALHSVLIGLTIGVSSSPCIIRPLLVAFVFHQFFEGFALGGCVSQAGFRSLPVLIMLLIFSSTTPFGIVLGIAISNAYNENSPTALITQGVMDSVSAGILIYMALVDLIAQDFLSKRMRCNLQLSLYSYAALFLGAGLMSTLAIWA